MKLLYQHNVGAEKFNFNVMANTLLRSHLPSIVLFSHTERNENGDETEYLFGFFCASQWRLSPNITGTT
jgi:hypothetical protein